MSFVVTMVMTIVDVVMEHEYVVSSVFVELWCVA